MIISIKELESIQDRLKELKKLLSYFRFSIQEQKILLADTLLDNAELENLTDVLQQIAACQKYLAECYQRYRLGKYPDTLDNLSANLEKLHSKLEHYKDYLYALSFLENLHAQKQDIEELLAEIRAAVAALDLDSIMLSGATEDLEKYLLLVKACTEKDRRTRFFTILQLSGHVDSRILFELSEDIGNFIYDERKVQDIQLKAISLEPSPRKAEVSLPVESGATKEETTPKQPKVEPVAAPVLEVTTPKEPKAAPVAVPVQEITTPEQPKVEPIAVPVQEVTTPEQPEEKVIDYNQLFLQQDKSIIVTEVSKNAAGSFSLNNFKTRLKSENIQFYRKIYGQLDKEGYINLERLQNSDDFQGDMQVFVHNQYVFGHLKRLVIKDHRDILILAPKGVQALKDKAFRSTLGFPKQPRCAYANMFANYNPFNVISFIKAREFILNAINREDYDLAEDLGDGHYTSYLQPKLAGLQPIILIGITSGKQEDALKCKNSVMKGTENSILIVAGLDETLAQRNRKWAEFYAAHKVAEENILYYSCHNDKATQASSGKEATSLTEMLTAPQEQPQQPEQPEQPEQIASKNEAEAAVAKAVTDNKASEAKTVTTTSEVEAKTSASETNTPETEAKTAASETNTPETNAEASEPKVEAPQEKEEAIEGQTPELDALLEKLTPLEDNIAVPEHTIVSYLDKEKKAITPKEFKKNFQGNKIALDLLTETAVNGYCQLEYIAQQHKKTPEACEFSVGMAHKAGLLRKMEFTNGASYYILSPKGLELLENKSIKTMLKGEEKFNDNLKEQYANFNALFGLIFADAKNYLQKVCNTDYHTSKSAIKQASFITFFLKKHTTYTAVSCYEPDLKVKYELFNSFKTMKNFGHSYLFFVGHSLEYAKLLAETGASFLKDITNVSIFYKEVNNDKTYTLDGSIYENIEELHKALENQSKPPIPQPQAQTEPTSTEPVPEVVSKADAPLPEQEQPETDALPEDSTTTSYLLPDNATDNDYADNVIKMLSAGKIYAACAYTKALAEINKDGINVYKQLAYAAGDPAGNLSYTSSVISSVYCGSESLDFNMFCSAALRNFFMDDFSYDYDIKQLQSILLNDENLKDNPDLAYLIKELGDFKHEFNHGLDFYADYKRGNSSNIEQKLVAVRNNAQEQFNYYFLKFKDDIANKRLSEARKLFFDKEGPVATYLKDVINGTLDENTRLELTEHLKAHFIKDNAVVKAENIDKNKIEAIIDDTWEKAMDHINYSIRSSDLMSALRTKYANQIIRSITPLCDYVYLSASLRAEDSDAAYLKYKKLRGKLLKSFTNALNATQSSGLGAHSSYCLLEATLKELQARLDGQYKLGSEKYFYLDFLTTEHVLLDEDYLPYLVEIDKALPKMSILRRIETHLSVKAMSLEKRAEAILQQEDNFTELLCILNYLDTQKPGYKEKFLQDKNVELSKANARHSLDMYRKEFEDEIELRQNYGQIDETESNRKENLLAHIDIWYEWAKESENYGFFKTICEAYIAQIEADALPRGKELLKKLNQYVETHPEKTEDHLIVDALATVKERIRCKNFAAAEDLLNNIENEQVIASRKVIDHDYLKDFLGSYSELYQSVYSMSRSMRDTLSRNLANNKEGKAAGRLLELWVTRPENCTEERVANLLGALEFPVGKVVARNKIGNAMLFDITLAKPEDGRKLKPKHPIAVFGSTAENEPFRVAFLFGNFEPQQLLEIFNNIGDSMDTLVFMESAMKISAKRTLARKTKELTKRLFAVIDRVVLAYLVKNYRQTYIQKLLMNTIVPFGYYQPYISNSLNVMPPEIFMGRETELDLIESHKGVNIVYGGRQLGKSAMLRMAQKHVDRNEKGDRAVYIDLVGLNYKDACKKVCRVLAEEAILAEDFLTEDWGELSFQLRKRLKSEENRIPYLLILLDEADAFIASSGPINYSPIEALQDVQGIGEGRFKFVLAGLRDVIRFEHDTALGNNSIMTKLPKLTVRPFNVNEARVLLEYPLSYLGFRFRKDQATEALISSIFSATNYFPGLLQMYCADLVNALQKSDYAGYDESDTPIYEISEDHIKKVLGGKELQKQIRDKFFITLKLDENDNQFYYIIALLVALQRHLDAENSDVTPEMIIRLADKNGMEKLAKLDTNKVKALMEELCELNILHAVNEDGYRFTRYGFYQMMGTEAHIEDELLRIMES